MTRSTTFVLLMLAVVALFATSVLLGNRIAAGGGAALLLAAIIYGFVRNKGGSDAEIARADAGARQLRHELDEDEARRGEG